MKTEEKIGKWIAYAIIAGACLVGLIWFIKFVIKMIGA